MDGRDGSSSYDDNTMSAAQLAPSVPAHNNWPVDPKLNPLPIIPASYPIERTSRRLIGTNPSVITSRISEACRLFSIHASYNSEEYTALLRTADHVVLMVKLYGVAEDYAEDSTISEDVVVETHKKRGQTMSFHSYSRLVLDAASGTTVNTVARAKQSSPVGSGSKRSSDFSPTAAPKRSSAPPRIGRPAALGRPSLSKGSSGGDGGPPSEDVVTSMIPLSYGGRGGFSHLTPMTLKNPMAQATLRLHTLRGLEVVSDLLSKDRIDAQRLGIESLCLLTDPNRTNPLTSIMAARVVLMGTTRQLDRQEVAHTENTSREFEESKVEDRFQELPRASSQTALEAHREDVTGVDLEEEEMVAMNLCIRDAILNLVTTSRISPDHDDDDDDDDESDDGGGKPFASGGGDRKNDDDENNDFLPDIPFGFQGNDERADKKDAVGEHNMLMHTLALAVLTNALHVFLKKENEFAKLALSQDYGEIIGTLINELRNVERSPHDAALSARCLHSLLSNSEDARTRVLNDQDAITVINRARQFGSLSHATLEKEVKKILKILNNSSS